MILAPESTTADLRHIFVSRLAMVSADSLKHRNIHCYTSPTWIHRNIEIFTVTPHQLGFTET